MEFSSFFESGAKFIRLTFATHKRFPGVSLEECSDLVVNEVYGKASEDFSEVKRRQVALYLSTAGLCWNHGSNVVTLGHKHASELMLSVYPPESASDFAMPWVGFCVAVPNGLLPNVEKIAIGTFDKESVVIFMLKNDAFIPLANINVWCPIANETELGRECELARRLLCGVIAELNTEPNTQERIRRAKTQGNVVVRSNKSSVFPLRREVVVDLRDRLKEALTAPQRIGHAHGPLAVRIHVRGHKRRVHVGPRVEGAVKIATVGSYWRGPDGAPEIAHTYRLVK